MPASTHNHRKRRKRRPTTRVIILPPARARIYLVQPHRHTVPTASNPNGISVEAASHPPLALLLVEAGQNHLRTRTRKNERRREVDSKLVCIQSRYDGISPIFIILSFTSALFITCHVTRQKILNWKQSLRFPSRPRVSPEGVNLMQQLLCDPEDRLGSQTAPFVSRPGSYIAQGRRSGFMPQSGSSASVDGAHLIKVCPLRAVSRT